MKNMEAVLVSVGGLLGAGARYAIGEVTFFPFVATFLANVIGCLLIGFIHGLNNRLKPRRWVWPLVVTGFCGGFTTMSTLSMELVTLLEVGEMSSAFLYLMSTLLVGILAVLIGHVIAKRMYYIRRVK